MIEHKNKTSICTTKSFLKVVNDNRGEKSAHDFIVNAAKVFFASEGLPIPEGCK